MDGQSPATTAGSAARKSCAWLSQGWWGWLGWGGSWTTEMPRQYPCLDVNWPETSWPFPPVTRDTPSIPLEVPASPYITKCRPVSLSLGSWSRGGAGHAEAADSDCNDPSLPRISSPGESRGHARPEAGSKQHAFIPLLSRGACA